MTTRPTTPTSRRRSSHLLAAALACAAALPPVLAADPPPSTQPSAAAAATTRPTHVARRYSGNRGLLKGDMPSDEEWKDVIETMAQYSPNRLKALEELGVTAANEPASPRVANLRRTVWLRYRDLQMAREHNDQELVDLKLKGIQLEDQVWALQRQFHEASDADRPVLRYQLRQRIGDLIRVNLKERELRIARLEKALAEEKQNLATDEKSVDQRIDERTRQATVTKRPTANDRRPDTPTNSSPALTSPTH